MALVLVGAAALTLVAAVLAMLAVRMGDLAAGAEMELLTRIQSGTRRVPPETWNAAPSFPTGPPPSPGAGEGPLRR